MKKLLLLFMMMLLSPIVASAHDIEVKNADGVTIYYNYINDGKELAVTFCGDYYDSYSNEYTGNLIIPDEVTYMNRTRKVTGIVQSAFRSCSLTSVTIPSSVTGIDKYAFFGCVGPTSVTINSNSIVSKNYSYDSNLGVIFGGQVKSYIIGDGVNSIGERAFEGCKELTSVTIPSSVTSIEKYAFFGCVGLTSVTIPEAVASIGDYAFRGCMELTSVTINSNSIVSKNYSYDSNLQTIFGEQVNNYNIIDGVTNIGDYAFYLCTGLTSVNIPSSVTSIGRASFSGCEGLTSVNIPKAVTSIGDYAFRSCKSLISVNIPEGVPDIGRWAFLECTELTSVIINSNSIVSNNYSYDSNLRTIFGEQVKDYIIGDGVNSIGNYAFYGCTGLTNVTIPSSVTSIGNLAFADCTDLTSVIIPSCVNNIGDYAFSRCTSLTSVTIPEDVTSIKQYTFSGCTGLTSVAIPSSVTSIESYAFSSCTRLSSVTIPSSITSIRRGAFSGCIGLSSVHILDLAAWCKITFENNPLYDAHHLYLNGEEIIDLVIPASVTSIENSAFSGCMGLTSVTIPSSVTSIGESAFDGCTGLTSLTISDGVTSIGERAFAYCKGLTYVVIPSSVTNLESEAFWYCEGLTSVTIGNSVTNIGFGAFDGADISTVISLIDNPFTINGKTSSDRTFTNNTFNNATLYVPIGTIDRYKASEGWKDFVRIEEGNPTGINAVEKTTNNNTTIYDLNGIRQHEPKKGVNIINGKKVVVK